MIKKSRFNLCKLIVLSLLAAHAPKALAISDSSQKKYGGEYSLGPSLLGNGLVGLVGRTALSPHSVGSISINYTPPISFLWSSITGHLSYSSGITRFLSESIITKSKKGKITELFVKKGIGFDVRFANYTTQTGLFSTTTEKIQDYSLGLFYAREKFRKGKYKRSLSMELGGRLGLLNINSTTTGGFSFGISNSFLGTNGGGNNNESSSSVRLAGAIILKIYWNFYSKEEYKR